MEYEHIIIGVWFGVIAFFGGFYVTLKIIEKYKRKRDLQRDKKIYISHQKIDISNILIETGATFNQKTVDKISDYFENKKHYFATGIQSVVDKWTYKK